MTLLGSTWFSWLYFTLHDSTLIYHGSISLYLTLHHSAMALLHPAFLYITLPWLYFTLHYHTVALLHSILLHLGSTSLYITLPWLYITLLWLYITLLWLYLTLDCSTMALLHSTCMTLHYPTLVYFTLLDSTLLYHHGLLISTWLTNILYHDSIWFYITLPWLYFTLLASSILALLHSTLHSIRYNLLSAERVYMFVI